MPDINLTVPMPRSLRTLVTKAARRDGHRSSASFARQVLIQRLRAEVGDAAVDDALAAPAEDSPEAVAETEDSQES